MPTLKDLQLKQKVFTNGHKVFTAAEMAACHELLHHEEVRRERFEANKYFLTKARNPITGEKTPRIDEGEGELCIHPDHYGYETYVIKPRKEVSNKIGIVKEGEANTPEIRAQERINSLQV